MGHLKKQIHVRIRRKVATADEVRALTPEEREIVTPRFDVPAEPTYGADQRVLRDEQQVLRCELLMMKGIRSKRTLMTLLEVEDERQIERYIQRVYARWEMVGTAQDHTRNRGESLSRLDLIESELWSKMQNIEDSLTPNAKGRGGLDGAKVSVVYLSTLLQVQRQRAELLGLTPKVIERIGMVNADTVQFTRNAASHERLSMLASRMMQVIEDRMSGKLIEHEPERSS